MRQINTIQLRRYRTSDCAGILRLFYDTVHTVNRKDYTEEQVEAWAPREQDQEQWNRSFLEHFTVIAVVEGRIAGFGDIDETGYLDRLYVHRDHQRCGIGTAICDTLERAAGAEKIRTHASVTARPFFEKRGYRLVKEQSVKRRGVTLTNYVMEKIQGRSLAI